MAVVATYRGYCDRGKHVILPGEKIELLKDGDWVHEDCLRAGDKLKDGWLITEMVKPRTILVEGTDEQGNP